MKSLPRRLQAKLLCSGESLSGRQTEIWLYCHKLLWQKKIRIALQRSRGSTGISTMCRTGAREIQRKPLIPKRMQRIDRRANRKSVQKCRILSNRIMMNRWAKWKSVQKCSLLFSVCYRSWPVWSGRRFIEFPIMRRSAAFGASAFDATQCFRMVCDDAAREKIAKAPQCAAMRRKAPHTLSRLEFGHAIGSSALRRQDILPSIA